MAQIKIVNFDLLQTNNIFFKECRKLKVDFELILLQSETELNKIEIEFSISCLTRSGRMIRAIAGKKKMEIYGDGKSLRNEHKYLVDENGKTHFMLQFISDDIPEQLLFDNKSDDSCNNLFITAELHNPMLQLLLGFAESAGKNFNMSTKAA